EDEQRAHVVADAAQGLGVPQAGVGGGAGDDGPGSLLGGQVGDLVVVEALVALGHAVGDELEEAAAEVDRRAVGEVAALVELHAHELVAGLEQREVDGHVGGGPRVGLHVGVLGAEELLAARSRQLFDLVDDVVAAVVALAGVALGVLVGEDRARGLQHLSRGEVLRRDQLERGALPLELSADDGEELGIPWLLAALAHWLTSISLICSMRGTWRPPWKSVVSQTRRISSASPRPTTRPPIASTLASLCRREYLAEYRSLHRAARMPWILLAVICS